MTKVKKIGIIRRLKLRIRESGNQGWLRSADDQVLARAVIDLPE
jgi:hypothetical protein